MSGENCLTGMKVLDLTQFEAGPSCTEALAWMGADVVKVEKTPDGDDTRKSIPPAVNGEPATFMMMNRNKRGIAIDLKTEGGRRVLKRMLETADIVRRTSVPP